ncbi:magnesium transporter protein 1-like [Erinaceus europaeus]|uniref:Magnesium transporter protein 1-like n=1 Tax=Erinaceus europaeus TaxID=9365 RepID=A0ABM3YL97_ERIEU|nr:magnesium transporter protein 1-like [Erinaceus europaeus]
MAEPWCLWRVLLTVVVALMFMVPGALAHRDNKKMILAEKVRQLMGLTKKNRVIRMNDDMFSHFVLDSPRNYSVIVMLTTLQRFKTCTTCEYAVGEFQNLVNIWQGSGVFTNEVFFALLDYDESPESFQILQLGPVTTLIHIPAKRKFTVDDIYNWKERGIIAKQMSNWVEERIEKRKGSPRIRQPQQSQMIYHKHVMLGTSLALITGLVYLLTWNRNFIFSRSLVAVLAVCFVNVMTAGQMWTYIKGAPYAQWNPHTGHTHYIHRVSYSQFTAEVYVVSLFNMWITLGILLIDKAATSPMNIMVRKIMSLTGICLVVIFFCWLLYLFRIKRPDYPVNVFMG